MSQPFTNLIGAVTRIPAVIVLLAAAASASAQEPGSSGPPPTPVRVESVRSEVLQERRLVTGDLRALRRSRVAAREPGLVLRRHVVEGQAVEQGEVLAELDACRLEVELRQIEADAAAAQALLDERGAEVDQRQRDLDLLRDSFERGAANPRELRDAEADLTVATARQLQASRLLSVVGTRADLLRVRIDDMQIRAPFAGIVLAVGTEHGEWVGEGETVLEMISTGPIEAWLLVPQRHLQIVRDGRAAVSVNIEATRTTIEATERRIIPLVDAAARTFTLVTRLENPEGLLSPGMSVTAWVPTSTEASVLTVPKNALLRNETGGYVYVLRSAGADGPSLATPTMIDILFPVGDRLAVRADGLQEGDQVVVEGNERLFPMRPVRPVADEAPAAGAAADRGTSG